MQAAKPKRFYKTVDVATQQNGAFHITLDGKTLRTPARTILEIPHKAHADLLRSEWDAQAEEIDADAMPVMRVFSIATDRMEMDKPGILDDMLRYLETDLVCYFSDESAVALKQAQHFAPLLQWFAAHYGAALATTHGLMPVAQPPELFVRIRSELEALDDVTLAALALITPLVGSIVLALALLHKQIDVQDALVTARIDEDMQAERYGVDPLIEKSWEPKKRDIIGAASVLVAA